jgi:prevent-host-death family protein
MRTVNMHDAKTNLSKLVEAIESGALEEVVISRNGKPVARLLPIEAPVLTPRPLGLAEAEFGPLDEDWFRGFQALDAVVWRGVLDEEDDWSPPISARGQKKKPA